MLILPNFCKIGQRRREKEKGIHDRIFNGKREIKPRSSSEETAGVWVHQWWCPLLHLLFDKKWANHRWTRAMKSFRYSFSEMLTLTRDWEKGGTGVHRSAPKIGLTSRPRLYGTHYKGGLPWSGHHGFYRRICPWEALWPLANRVFLGSGTYLLFP